MSRRLGQHFLINKRQLRKFVEALELKTDDTVVEIGPGHGEITEELRSKNYELRISAIEKDKKFVQVLQKKFASDKNIKIVEGDALKILPELTKSYKLKTKNYKVVGNIPYYLTGILLRILGELENKPSLIVLIIQKEVAQRITAKPPRMNLLAASVQFWAESEIISYISKRDFRPAPKVDSTIIKLRIKNYVFARGKSPEGLLGIMDNYYKFIKVIFKQPRKTILNNLKSQISNLKNKEEIIEKLVKIGINPSDRPQNLGLEQLRQLSTLF